MPWFMERLRAGWFEVVNPFNNRSRMVPAGPDQVHSIVFWSKNFGPFIDGGYGMRLKEMGYHLFFNFTVNSAVPVLEPAVPPLQQRLEQLAVLSRHFNPRAINWRFDPLSFFSRGDGSVHNNLDDFSTIAARASDAGIQRCITSFMDHYPKIARRIKSMAGFEFLDPPVEEKVEILYRMQATLSSYGIELQTCCEKEVLKALPDDFPIGASSCVPNDLLAEMYGEGLSLKKDTGQRVKAGCGCRVSTDIGSYAGHPCYHRCLYCYASPVVA